MGWTRKISLNVQGKQNLFMTRSDGFNIRSQPIKESFAQDSMTEQKMTGESLLPRHVELLTPYSAHKKPKVRPNRRLLLGVVGVTFIIGWLSILTSNQNM